MHEPVLVGEVVELLLAGKEGTYIDGTVGSGGHAAAILGAMGDKGFLLGIDRDIEAIERVGERLASWGDRQCLVHGNFQDMEHIAKGKGVGAVQGVLLDVGVSLEQLESSGRGFSFMRDGPLDMRMDRSDRISAKDLVNSLCEADLVQILREYGEEPRAGRIAAAIVKERGHGQIESTAQLAGIVERVSGRQTRKQHSATLTFQALRIAVNDELSCLRKGLSAGWNLLKVGGRMAVISFHRLEDRIAKEFCRRHVGRWESLPWGGQQWRGQEPRGRLVTRGAVKPSPEEVRANPRARSARLRVIERMSEGC